ncbi:hypothetical protein ABZ814_20435 [Micromonospora musae]|uniref:hypothetical protein n=1 Tax=Micromonospora musae TaxID=1894970 RepID=UPI0033E05AF4
MGNTGGGAGPRAAPLAVRMASSFLVINDLAKDHLHSQLGSIRQVLIWKPGGDAGRNPDLVEARP